MAMSVVKSAAADLKAHLAENPGAVIEDVARQWGVSPREVIEALPAGMARLGPGEGFVPAMAELATWGEVTLIVHSDDAIFEFTGEVPRGEIGRGYFNLMQPKGLHGHLKHDNCGAVAFVERPFMGKSSAFVAFLNQSGGVMFKVFVGRDEKRELRADQMARFRVLADQLGGEPVD
ncbi:heme utilization cystosolic carrier protein HutX [Rhodopseudomonas sp. HC1]|uniref:heme utilization cystosolic carrier protein HutX n=1 Tax=Rhodopseudomonas infernalis TaxID=2897386 RepID=UPI001EE81AC4|nr:heme utilization cystosolic carrier protein HutX [Rhodopseudomonas infernalis]MCG6204631.1 heme utilization cystosolic carrier protein HutX [Rhodopseudomonas infernalis]